MTNWFALGVLIPLLWACEAPFDLTATSERALAPIRATDRFQAAARNDNVVVVVGDVGTVLVSNDRGMTWERLQLPSLQPPILPDLIDVVVCPDGTFAALDAARGVWFAGTEGRAWAASDKPLNEDGFDLACDLNGRVWVVGAFTQITSTADQGQTWQDQSIGEDAIFTSIQFTEANTGIIFGEFGLHYRSQDGGGSWQAHKSVPNDFYSLASWFETPQKGWLTGLQGAVLHTSDGGNHWVRQDTDVRVPIYGLAAQDKALRAVGGRGTIFRLTDRFWREIELDDAGYSSLRAVISLGGGDFLIAGTDGKILILDGTKS